MEALIASRVDLLEPKQALTLKVEWSLNSSGRNIDLQTIQ
jgi:hypothetical protein